MKNLHRLTIGELKKQITDLPEDLEVVLNWQCHDIRAIGTKSVNINGTRRDYFVLSEDPED